MRTPAELAQPGGQIRSVAQWPVQLNPARAQTQLNPNAGRGRRRWRNRRPHGDKSARQQRRCQRDAIKPRAPPLGMRAPAVQLPQLNLVGRGPCRGLQARRPIGRHLLQAPLQPLPIHLHFAPLRRCNGHKVGSFRIDREDGVRGTLTTCHGSRPNRRQVTPLWSGRQAERDSPHTPNRCTPPPVAAAPAISPGRPAPCAAARRSPARSHRRQSPSRCRLRPAR